MVHCPERAIPGNTLYELVNNDRIIGAASEESAKKAADLYGSFVKGKIFRTDTTTAECVKLVENTSRDVQIALANELAQIANEIDIDVIEVIDLANRHPRVQLLKPGAGVGVIAYLSIPGFLLKKLLAEI